MGKNYTRRKKINFMAVIWKIIDYSDWLNGRANGQTVAFGVVRIVSVHK